MIKNNKAYNILYIDRFTQMWGSEVSLFGLIYYLDRKRFNPVVVLPDGGPLSRQLQEIGVKVILIPLDKLREENPFPYLRTVYRLFRIIGENKIDLVHANCDLANQYGLPAARMRGVPIIGHIRNILGKRAFSRMFLAYADALIANSQATERAYLPYVRPVQKHYVVYNGVDLREFNPSSWQGRNSWRKRLGIQNDTMVVAVVARITPNKGQYIFLRAFAKVIQQEPDCCALIIGDPIIGDPKVDPGEPYLRELQTQANDLGIRDKTIFMRFVDRIAEIYAEMDLLVLPSLAEPFGRVLIEAMAMGKPVVATQAGGVVEVVEDGVTGFLVPPKDDWQLAEAMLKIIQNGELSIRLGQEGRRRVERFFSIQENVHQIEQVYMELLRR